MTAVAAGYLHNGIAQQMRERPTFTATRVGGWL